MVFDRAAAGVIERLPPGRSDPHAAERVVDYAHFHHRARARGERLAKALADAVGGDPVHLEERLALGAPDRLEHRRIGLGAVAKEPHRVVSYPEPGRAARGVVARPHAAVALLVACFVQCEGPSWQS
jgi:hypothetical protein